MKILVFADLHYFTGTEKLFNAKRKLVEFAEPMLDALKGEAERRGADLVVNLGDLIQDTNNKEQDLASLAYIFGRLKEFPCPVYSVLGNHDLKLMDSLDEVAVLIEQNKPTFSQDLGGYHLVFLSPELRPELGLLRGGSYKTQYVGEKTLAWLEEDLKANALPTLLFAHFPFAKDPRVKDECMFLEEKEGEALKAILRKDGKTKAVFVGHQHTPRFVEEDGIPHYIVGSPTVSLLEDGIPIGVFRLIEIDEASGGLSIQECHATL